MNVRGFILPARIIGVCILIVEIVPVGLGLWLYKSTSAFLGRAASTQGTVVEIRPSGDEGTTYHTVFEYKDQSGATHRKVSTLASNPPSHSVGEKVEVLYVPGEPSDGRIKDFMSLWFGPVLCAAMTLPPLLVSLVFLWLIPFTIRRVWPEPCPEVPC